MSLLDFRVYILFSWRHTDLATQHATRLVPSKFRRAFISSFKYSFIKIIRKDKTVSQRVSSANEIETGCSRDVFVYSRAIAFARTWSKASCGPKFHFHFLILMCLMNI